MRKQSTLGTPLDLELLSVFCRVAETSSFVQTGRELDMTTSAVSKRISRLEARLDVQLLTRTTRRVVPTDAGLELYQRGVAILGAVEEAQDAVSMFTHRLRGVLRVSGPMTLGEFHLAPLLPEFTERYPEIQLDLVLSDRWVNLVDEHFDLAVRVGQLPDSTLRVRRMGKAPMVVVGSPEYFARHGRPELPADLLGHRCIRYSLTPVGREWRFHVDGRPTTIPVNAQVHLNNGGAICAAAVGGRGVARLPLFCVEDAIDSGRLEVVLADFAPPPFDVVAIYPPAKKLPAKTRAFIDFIAPRLRRRLRQKVS